MADDRDLARLLPDPPPPRAAARDAAITAAMRRFDGVPDPVPATVPGHRPARWVSGKQIGAFATIVFVAGISLSIALNRPGGLQPGKVEQPPAVTAPRSAPAPSSTLESNRPGAPAVPAASDSAAATGPAPVAKPSQALPSPTAPAAPIVSVSGDNGRASGALARPASPAPAPPAPPAPPPPPPAAMAPPMRFALRNEPPTAPADDRAVTVTGNRAQPKMTDSASPASLASRKADDNQGGADVVVTGSRVRGRNAYAARGDWNACTVIDPEQSLRGCRGLIGIGTKGAGGEAGTRLSDGLTLAWRGDLDGAVAAFDQAIALKPKFAFAYLNRGLAYQRAGDTARAAADLDLAIKYAPYSARGYYIRSVLRREQGNRRGADADANRAVQLDPDYPDPTP